MTQKEFIKKYNLPRALSPYSEYTNLNELEDFRYLRSYISLSTLNRLNDFFNKEGYEVLGVYKGREQSFIEIEYERIDNE